MSGCFRAPLIFFVLSRDGARPFWRALPEAAMVRAFRQAFATRRPRRPTCAPVLAALHLSSPAAGRESLAHSRPSRAVANRLTDAVRCAEVGRRARYVRRKGPVRRL